MTAIGTPLLSHEFGWDRPPDQDGNTADASDPGGEAYERTAYQYDLKVFNTTKQTM